MTARFKASTVIDRPVATVFHFYADEHIRNHPRWDPDIELWPASDGPMGVGTMIRRRNSRSGTSVDGTMEVIEYERDRTFALVIRDGPVEMRGRTLFEADGEDRTIITTVVELPGMDDSMDTGFLTSRLERSGQHIKQLIESET
ncbi:MAG: SRPBCC family protein [Bacteroidota bacterium]